MKYQLLALLLATSSVASAQTLLFKSGFESTTALGSIPGSQTCSYGQPFSGTDSVSGYTWPPSLFGGNFELKAGGTCADVLVNHFFNSIQTVTGHTGSSTKALFIDIDHYTSECCPQAPFQSFSLAQPLKQVYWSYWVMWPAAYAAQLDSITNGYGREQFGWKTNDDYRETAKISRNGVSGHAIHSGLKTNAGGKAASNTNSCPFADPITGATISDCARDFYDVDNESYILSFGTWHHFEFFVQRVKGGPGGRLFTAVDGHISGDYLYTFDSYGVDNQDVADIYWANLYGNDTTNSYPLSQTLDDFEVWDSPPCGHLPCDTQVGSVPPAIISWPAAVGTVGVPFSFQPRATGTPTSWDWSGRNGSTPPGLSLNSSTGLISGTPTTSGRYQAFLNARNSTGGADSVTYFQINSSTVTPIIKSFGAFPTTITNQGVSTLYANALCAGSCTYSISNVGNVSGPSSITNVSPTATTTYTLTVSNSAGTVTASTTVTVPSSRQLGPEPGIQFSNPPTTPFCQYGEYQRVPSSAFGGNCANFLKTYDIFPTLYGPTAPTQSIPANLVDQYAIKVIWTDGQTYNGFINLGSSTGMNIADVNYQNYYWGNYTQNVTVPNFQNKTGTTVTPSNPLYISGDAWFATYGVWGADVNGVSRGPVTWAPGYPQNATAWSLGWQAFFTAAKNLAPNIRIVPHLASQDPIVWINFKTIFQDCPGLQKEHFPLSEPTSDPPHRLQIYNQIMAFYWFANVAAPVFPNIATEPRTRMTQWGADIDQTVSTQLHTALAMYALSRGTNSFFDLITTGSTTADPNLWLPTAQALGTVSSAGAPQVTFTAPNHVVGDGFNMITRQYPGGIVYYNMSSVVQHPVPPVGAKDWVGNPVTSLTLADGQGEVLLTGAAPPPLAQKSIIGGIVSGAIVQ